MFNIVTVRIVKYSSFSTNWSLGVSWGLDKISLMNKAFERVIMKKIERKVEGGINDAQRGFHRDSATENSWIRAKGYLRLSECKYVLGIFLDFKKTLVTWNCLG